MNKSKDDDNKIGEESLHDVRVSSDTSTLPHQNKSIKDYDDSGNESKQHTKLTSKESMLGVNLIILSKIQEVHNHILQNIAIHNQKIKTTIILNKRNFLKRRQTT